MDTIDEVIPETSVVLPKPTTDPVMLANPNVLDPVPVTVELNLDSIVFIS